MGIFTREDRHGNTRLRVGRIAGAGVTSVFALFAGLSSFYINQERQVSLEVLFGSVTNEVKSSGLKFKNPLATRYAYPLTLQTTSVNLPNLRLGDDIRLSGTFEIEYQINPDADIRKLYYDLKGQGGDLDTVVDIRANDAAVRAVEALSIADLMPPADALDVDASGNVAPVEATSFTEKMTSGILARTQEALTRNGWPVTVLGVHSKGFNFQQESEDRIADMVGIRMEAFKLALRKENAVTAQAVFQAEAEADAAYINILREQGLPDDAVAQALCLKMARDAGRVNEPFAAGCGAPQGGNGVGVVVDPNTVRQTQTPRAPAP